MRGFSLVSGLEMNTTKSNIFELNVDPNSIISTAGLIGCRAGQLPFDYLWLKMGANMNLCKNWLEVIDPFEGRLSSWEAKRLSLARRVTLIKSVLDSLPIYYLSIPKAPSKVIENLEKIRRRFLWGGAENSTKINWVCWTRVIAPKEEGGLGLGSLKHLSDSLLLTWWWRFHKETNLIWSQAIKAIHKSKNESSLGPKVKKDMAELNVDITQLITNENGVWTWEVTTRAPSQWHQHNMLLETLQQEQMNFTFHGANRSPVRYKNTESMFISIVEHLNDD
uniref:uncharacterized protein LOC122597052 n=1 Tax=Erigeron canadensis TaxID=72917 RepID=UPI001CB8BC9B|nr:uncharacterized protein LOC122597052 [Erigeron canadensis]